MGVRIEYAERRRVLLRQSQRSLFRISTERMEYGGSVVTGEKIRYGGWENVWRLANSEAELLVTADVGPRIIHFGFAGGENEFYEVSAQKGKTGGQEFRMYGGHRLWVAPETSRTDYPDNGAVEVQRAGESFRFIAPAERTGLQKTIEVQLSPDKARVRVLHRIKNLNSETQKVSAWALTVLRPGGTAVLPLLTPAPHGPEHLLPVTSLTLWSYTDLTAPCWKLGPRFLRLEQKTAPVRGFGMQKIGIMNGAGWGAYVRGGHVFEKHSATRDGTFVDGANFEMFANKDFLELETLSPEEELTPGETCDHTEEWSLREGTLGDVVVPEE